ncbi:MAG: SMC family ATPase [Synergistetes bacterium]|nr:SMC family ATPase [Synergistota bacterium]MCX8127159.1 SMC family ATPase [Synergistota bacterium]MDW8191955.1 SMC family ATPase [Synergistota bacterium]
MKPLRLVVRNFMGLRDVDISFVGKEVFVIQGPNGAGKSSILEAIYFALFGRTLRHGTGYEGVVNRESNDGKALVELEFSHHGKRWRIKREVIESTRKGSVYLECLDTMERIASSIEASKRIERLIGLTSETFKTTVLLPQGEITRFLELTGTDRMKVLKELLSGNKLSRIAEYAESDLKGKEGELRVYTAQISAINLEELKKEKERILPQIDELEFEISKIAREIEALEKALNELRGKESALKELARDKELMESLRRRKDRALLRLSEIENKISEGSDIEKRLISLLESVEDDYEKERSLFETLESVWDKILPLKTEFSSLENEFKSKVYKVKRIEEEIDVLLKKLKEEKQNCEYLREEEEKLKESYERAREKYFTNEVKRGLKVGDLCPVCGSVITSLVQEENIEIETLKHLRKLYEDASKRRQEREKSLTGIEGELRERERYRRELISEITLSESRLKEKGSLLEEMLNYIKKQFGEQDLEGLRARKKAKMEELRKKKEEIKLKMSSLKASLKGLSDEKVNLENELVEVEKELSILSEKIAALESRIDTSLTLEEIQREITLRENDIRAKRSERDSLNAELWRKRSRLEAIDKDIKNYNSLKSKVEILQAEVGLLSELKKNLSDSNFPKFLVSHYLMEAANIANSYLSRLTKGRYLIEATEKLDLFVIDEDIGGERRSMRDLSGGEKVLISLSLALGIAEVLAGGLEAFFIDEGFSPLDRENLDMVAHELTELDNSGKLIGIITHDPVFADYFAVKLLVNGGKARWA